MAADCAGFSIVLFRPLFLLGVLVAACHSQEPVAPRTSPPLEPPAPAPAPPATGKVFKAASSNPVGVWRVEDKRSDGATGVCALPGFEGGASNVMITTTPGFNEIRWSEDGDAPTTTIGVDDCSIAVTVTRKKSFAPPDGGGLGYDLTMKFARKLNVSGRVMSGIADVEVTTSPPLKGTPCHAIYEVTGKHL